MSETLKTVLDKYIESQNKVVFRENAVPEDKDGYVDAIKQSLTDKIYDEIRAEVRDEALADASKIIEEKAGLKRIDEFKKLAINGVIVAFFVGLLVNQSTEAILFSNRFGYLGETKGAEKLAEKFKYDL